ncbi:MAG: zinc ribbon domain-containing protein [Candidatus Coproplasma sp.]
MKKFKFKSLFCALTALVTLTPLSAIPAFAYAPLTYDEGVISTGIYCVENNSVLELQSQTLTYDIGTPIYELKGDEKYDSKVTAEYVFRNPTEATVTAKMAYPVCGEPNYAQYDDKVQKVENPITVGGQPVEYQVRHTYGTSNSFEEDAKKIKDSYFTTDFFTTDLPVTEYVFKANLAEKNEYATFKVEMPQNTGTRYFCDTDYKGNFYYRMYDGTKFSVFVLGNDPDLSNLNWSITQYSNLLGRDIQVNGSVTLEKKLEPTTFKDYVLKNYDSLSDVSEVDYYNAMFDLINKDGIWAGNGATPYGGRFTEWYVYETSIEAGATVTCAVTANLYPTVYYNSRPFTYEYNFYISPAGEWASVGSLTVNINTEQFMQKGEVYDSDDAENSLFQKTETGYTATLTSLSNTELSFKTCSVQTPDMGTSSGYVGIYVGLAVGIILLSICIGIPLIIGLTVLIVVLVKRKKKNKALKQNTPTDQPTTPQTPSDEGDNGDGTGEENNADGTVEDGENCEDTSNENNGEEGGNPEICQAIANGQTGRNFCTVCGNRIQGNAKFCTKCGEAIPRANYVRTANTAVATPVLTSAPADNGGKVNGLGIAGFAVSILSLIMLTASAYFCALLVFVGFGLSLAGVILKKKYPKVSGLAIAGLVVSSIMIFIFVIIISIIMLSLISLNIGSLW